MTQNNEKNFEEKEQTCSCDEKNAKETCDCQKESCDCQDQAQKPLEEMTVVELIALVGDTKEEAAKEHDLYIRAVAEMENTRRRSMEEVQKARKYGIEKFAENLLPVVDSLEKALEVTQEDDGPHREGMLATYRQMMHALEMSGMKVINPQGETFDPAQHQAIAMVPATDGQKPGSVMQVFQRGWLISGRVLRPAMVSVAQ